MFDPPHLGHLILATEAAWQLRLDEVRLVVCARPTHRRGSWLAPEARLRLVERAVAGSPALRMSRAEVDRPGPSFTVDTLEAFAREEPGASLWLVMGADQLRDFARWRAPERIVELARIAAVAREGEDPAEGLSVPDVAHGRVDRVHMPAIGVSSSMIRGRIDAGEPVGHLLPPGVGEALAGEGLSVRLSAIP